MKNVKVICLLVMLIGLVLFTYGQNEDVKFHYQNSSLLDANSTPTIFNRDNLLSNQFLTASFQMRTEGNLQKLILTPFKLKTPKKYNFLHETRFNFAQQAGLTTIGIGIGFDNASPFGKRGKRLQQEQNSTAVYYENLTKNSFQIVAGANVTLFENWGSPSRDVNKDSLVDNFYSVASSAYTIGIIYIASSKFGLHASAHYRNGKEDPVEGTKDVTLVGYAIGFAARIAEPNIIRNTFLNEKSGFTPSINIGLTFEHILPIKNRSYLNNGNTYVLAYSPYLDFKLTSISQIRLSIPIKAIEGKQDERGFGPFLQFYIQL